MNYLEYYGMQSGFLAILMIIGLFGLVILVMIYGSFESSFKEEEEEL